MFKLIKAALLLLALLSTQTPAATTVRYQHTDILGSVVAETDAAANIISRSHYEPFGKRSAGDKAGISYTGHLQDEDLNLIYMQQRYYDPVIGRFYSNDPVGFTASNPMMFNRYAYANNNPYKFVDPDGRNPFIVYGDSDNATLTRESFKEAGDMFVAGMEHAGALMFDAYVTAGGLIPGIGGLAVTGIDVIAEVVTTGGVSKLSGAVTSEMVGKGVEANIDTSKMGKVGVAIDVVKEIAKPVVAKLTEKHVAEHQKNEVKKDGTTAHRNDENDK